MAYFDSPKNRAMWERRMAGLRQEKERRKEMGYEPQQRSANIETAQANPFRKKIGLEKLEQIEQEKSNVRRVRRPTKTRSMEKSEPQKNGRTL